MYNKLLHLFILLIGVGCSGGKQKQPAMNDVPSNGRLNGTIQLSGAFALYPMAVKWAEEFRKIHPHVTLDISGGGTGKGMTDLLSGMVDIGLVSREVYPEELKLGAYPIAVAKDAVVLTVHARNPEIETIRRVGLSRAKADQLWSRKLSTWGELLGNASKLPIHVFTRSDACGAAETFAAWFGKSQEELQATALFGDPGIAAAVQKDRLAIGYNNMAYTYDQQTKKPFDGLAVMPIDLDGDGSIAPEECFYESSETLMQAIQTGRYPSPPARDLYLITKGKPLRPEVVAWLSFVLTDGQQYLHEIGYIGLSTEQLEREIAKLK